MMKRLWFHIVIMIAAATLVCGCKGVEPYHKPKKDISMSSGQALEEICANGLPVMFLETPDGAAVTSKHQWTRKAILETVSPDGTRSVDTVKVKGHGNGTWRNYPKKPYSMVFGRPVRILGMEPGRRYVLLANWRDRTLLRNAVALEISRKTCLDWTPDGRFIELVLNGKFYGTYYLTEKVNIEDGDFHVPVGPDGFLLDFDTGGDKAKSFRTEIKDYPVEVPNPLGRKLSAEKRWQIRDYVNDIEEMLYLDKGDWHEVMDIDSFCDWLIVQEVTGNPELTRPRSCYMHVTSDGIIHAGPCWDYDYKTFIRNKSGLLYEETLWYDALMKDNVFRERFKARWAALKPVLETEIPPFMKNTWHEIEKSEALNHRMWPIIGWFDNHDEHICLEKAVSRMEKRFLKRIADLDKAIAAMVI